MSSQKPAFSAKIHDLADNMQSVAGKARAFNYPLLTLSLVLLSIVVGGGLLAITYMGDKARADIARENEASISVNAIQFLSEVEKLQEVSQVLADSPYIVAALTTKSARDFKKADAILDVHNATISASVSYILDSSGTCVASSNRNSPESFVGTNYRFRDYFDQSIKGGKGYSIAYGVHTLKMGFFASYPVKNTAGKIIGVVAMKENVADMGVEFSLYQNSFFVDKHGVIVFSDQPEMVLKTLWPLDNRTQQAIIASKQFGSKLSGALLEREVSDGTLIMYKGKYSLVSRKPVGPDNWTMVRISQAGKIPRYKAIGVLVTLLICVLLLIPLVLTARASVSVLRERERLMDIISFLPDATFVIDTRGTVVAWNKALEELTGIFAADIVGKGNHEYALPFYGIRRPMLADLAMKRTDAGEALYSSIRRDADTFYGEALFVMNGGQKFYCLAKASPLYTEAGRITGAIETMVDISSLKKAEDAMRESEEHFRVLTENSSDVIMRFDRELRHVYVNAAVERETGIPAEKFIGKTHEELGFPRDLCKLWEDAIEKVFREGKPCQVEFTLPNGAWIDWKLVPEFNKDKTTVSYVLTAARDMTNLKRSAERLRRINDCLLNLGVNPKDNINRLTALCGEMLGASFALYNSLEKGHLCDSNGWQLPALDRECRAVTEYMFYEGVRKLSLFAEEDLEKPQYGQISAEVKALGIKSYAGHLVRRGQTVVGSLSAVFIGQFSPTQEDRQIIGLLAAAIGTEELRKHAEDELFAEKERIRVTLRSIGDGVIVTDKHGRITLINTVAEETTGWKEEEALGRQLTEVFHLVSEKTRLPSENPVNKVLREGKVITMANHTALIARDGTMRAIADSGAPILDGAGKIQGVVLVFRDVSEERGKQGISEKFRYMTEMTTDWLWEINAHAVYTYVSPKVRDVLGYEAKAVIGKSLFDLMSVEETLRVEPVIRQSMTEHLPFFLSDNINIHKDGHEVIFETHGVPVFDDDHTFCGYRGIGRDITERRKKDAMLLKLEIENKASEAANQAKSMFLATMSHELRTPLNVIIVSGDVLSKNMFGALNEKQKEYVDGIINSGRHLLSLINDILDLSKVEADKMELHTEPQNLCELFQSINALLGENVAKSQLTLRMDIDPVFAAPVAVDTRKFRQIVLNLLSNALKFTPANGLIALSASKISAASLFLLNATTAAELSALNPGVAQYILVSVRDNGIGIRPEDMGKLFRPFSQVEDSDTRNYEGTGLGLALVKRFVELHKGRVWAESTVGKGSVFTFVIPI